MLSAQASVTPCACVAYVAEYVFRGCSEDVSKELHLLCGDDLLDGWCSCSLSYLGVGYCGDSGVDDFGVVGGFDVEDSS